MIYFSYVYIFLAVAANTEIFIRWGCQYCSQVAGFSVQSASWPCWPLSRPIENPQALKSFSLYCFLWLRPYLNTLHTPTHPERNTNRRSYRATWNCSDFYLLILFLTWLAIWPVCLFDPSHDWLEIRFGWAGTELLQAPRRICCGCDSSTAGLESVFSLSQKGGMSADCQTQPVEPAMEANTLCLKCPTYLNNFICFYIVLFF